MGRFWDRWDATEGDKISGIIFYFQNRDGSYSAIVRAADHFWVLPAEAAEVFIVGRPDEGSEVEIEKVAGQFQLKILPRSTFPPK